MWEKMDDASIFKINKQFAESNDDFYQNCPYYKILTKYMVLQNFFWVVYL